MKCLAVIIFALLLPAVRADLAEDAEAAKKAIQKVLDDQDAAWNKGDLEGFMKGYWKSDKLTFFSAGTRTQGWQATLERYQKKYQGEGKEMGKLTFSELEVEILGPDAAVVRGRFQLVTSKEKPTGLFTLLLRKFPEGWRIVHDHTSG
jgi:beta-aspartyl-peptidase (threonine type)